MWFSVSCSPQLGHALDLDLSQRCRLEFVGRVLISALRAKFEVAVVTKDIWPDQL